jgi:acyl-CoA thioester hydrolase
VGEADGLVESYRGGVSAWECDIFGHLNIAFYVERFAAAAEDLLERLAPGLAWRTLTLDTEYEHELRAGEGIAIRSGVIAVEDAAVRLGHVALNSSTGARSTRVVQRVAPVDPDRWPSLREALGRAVMRWTGPDFVPVGLPAGAGPVSTGRDRARPWEMDERGELRLLGYLMRFSNACLHLVDAIGMTDHYRRTAQRGFATFDTRLTIESPARAGTGLVASSFLLDVGTSSLKFLHRLHETRSGRLAAQFYQAGVQFDLEARRSAPLPPEIRERAQALRVVPPN